MFLFFLLTYVICHMSYVSLICVLKVKKKMTTFRLFCRIALYFSQITYAIKKIYSIFL